MFVYTTQIVGKVKERPRQNYTKGLGDAYQQYTNALGGQRAYRDRAYGAVNISKAVQSMPHLAIITMCLGRGINKRSDLSDKA